MKRILFLYLILLSSLAFGQENERHRQIQAMKTAYITEELQLSSSEAEKFWPVYNAYRKDLSELHYRKYKILREHYRLPLDQLTNAKALQMIALAKRKAKDEAELLEVFQRDLLKVLAPPKVFMLNRVEEGFKRKLLHWYSENKE